MQIKITKSFGPNTNLEIEVEDKKDRDAIAKALFFTEPDQCGLCGGDDIVWRSNKAQEKDGNGMFTYIKRYCLKPGCRAQSTAGEYKDGGFFWKAWEIYRGGHENAAPAASGDVSVPGIGRPMMPRPAPRFAPGNMPQQNPQGVSTAVDIGGGYEDQQHEDPRNWPEPQGY